MEGHVATGVLELVVLGTSNTLKTSREVMDSVHFLVPGHLWCCPGDEAHSVEVGFGLVFLWLVVF